MYIILVYDISSKRAGYILKLCRRYLNWVQNSVFEGEITEKKYQQLSEKIYSLIDQKKDSVIFYTSRQESWLTRKVVGMEKNPLTNII